MASIMHDAWQWYVTRLERSPMGTQIVTSAVLWTAGDVIAQKVDASLMRRRRRKLRMPEGAGANGHVTVAPESLRQVAAGEKNEHGEAAGVDEVLTSLLRLAHASPMMPSSVHVVHQNEGQLTGQQQDTSSDMSCSSSPFASGAHLTDVAPGSSISSLAGEERGKEEDHSGMVRANTESLQSSSQVAATAAVGGAEIRGTPLDPRRCFGSGSFGAFFMGTIGHVWYDSLDRLVTQTLLLRATSPRAIVTKIVLDTFLLGPIYVASFLSYTGLVAGHSVSKVKQDLKDDFKTAFLAEALAWPMVQAVNFALVPVQHQLLFVNVFALLDSVFLSWYKHKDDHKDVALS